MLYLAKVLRKNDQDNPCLLLIAQQSDEQEWITLASGADETIIPAEEANDYKHGSAVLIELSGSQDITTIRDATEWLLHLVDQYFSAGLTPDALKQEAERIEQWRKSLTLKSQDIVRQTLEVETRRDQIQELETKLEQERKQLEIMTAHLQNLETKLEDERRQLRLVNSAEETDTRLPDPTNSIG